MNKKKAIEILSSIAKYQKKDAKEFDGQPFTGKTMAEYNGRQGAAIVALADIMILILEDLHGD